MASNESVLPSEKIEDAALPSESELIDLKTDGKQSSETGTNDEKKETETKNEEPTSKSQEIKGEDRQIVKPCETTTESLAEGKSENVNLSAQNIEAPESKSTVTESDTTELLKVTKEHVEAEKTDNVGDTSAKILDSTPSDISEAKDIDSVVDKPVESNLSETSGFKSQDGSVINQRGDAPSAESLTKTIAEPIVETHKEADSASIEKTTDSKSEDPEKGDGDACKNVADIKNKEESSQMEAETENEIKRTQSSIKETSKDAESHSGTKEDQLQTIKDMAELSEDMSKDKHECAPVSKAVAELGSDKLEHVPLSKPATELGTGKPEDVSLSKPVAEHGKDKLASASVSKPIAEFSTEKVENVSLSKPVAELGKDMLENVSLSKPETELCKDKLEDVSLSKPETELCKDKPEDVFLSKPAAEFSKDKVENVPLSKPVAEAEKDKVESEKETTAPQPEVPEKSEKSDVKLTEEILSTEKKDSDQKEVANFPMSKFSRSSPFEETEEKMEVDEGSEPKITEEPKSDAKPLENFQLKHDRVENLKNVSNFKSAPSPVSEDTSEDSQFSMDVPASPGTTKPTIKKPSFVPAFKETAMDVEGDNSMDVPMFDTPLGTPISMLADESIDNADDTRASVISNDVSGPTPTKKPRMGSLISARKEFVKLVITVDKLYEYQWPQGEGEWHMLQEQVSEYLSIKSFKRKYPDMYRRFVDKEEKEFLMDRGVVTETHCDLGLTAVRSEDIYDLMYKDYPEKYEEFLTYMHGKQRETIYEQHKEYDVPNVEKSKLAEYMKKAVKSAAEFNSQMQKERREERKAFFDLQTFNVHYPVNRYKKLTPELTKASTYPIALIPGQFQDHYTTYTSDELKYLPINTSMFDAPKWMESEQPKEANHTSEVEDSQEEKTASSDSESGSDSGSDSGDEKEEKEKEKEKVKAEPVKETTCRRCEIKNKNKKRIRRIKEEIINCSECGAGGHPTCLELTEEMVGVIQTYPWQCMECKTCVECMDPYDEDKMMFCDRCDRGYHTFCVGMKAIPTGRWECKSCKGTTASITETPKKRGK